MPHTHEAGGAFLLRGMTLVTALVCFWWNIYGLRW